MTRLDLTTARCEALFASSLQPSERPDPAGVHAAVVAAVRSYGSRGCAAVVAQEFGDHPDTAPARMRWARSLVAVAYAAPAGPRFGAGPLGACALPVPVAA